MNMSMSSWSESFPSKPKGGFAWASSCDGILDVQHLEFRPTLQLEALVRFCTVFVGFLFGVFYLEFQGPSFVAECWVPCELVEVFFRMLTTQTLDRSSTVRHLFLEGKP